MQILPQYIPILRWKRAEQDALRDLFPSTKSRVTPLIEIPEIRIVEPAMLRTCASSVAMAWGDAPFYFDFGKHLPNVSMKTVNAFYSKARDIGLAVIPVTRLAGSIECQQALAKAIEEDKRGVCIRVFREDLGRTDLGLTLKELMRALQQDEGQVDVVIDLKIFRPGDANLGGLLHALPNLNHWRTVAIVAGSFPKDLTGLDVGQHELERKEWTAWNTAIRNHDLTRIPSFGDYTILHPILSDPIPGMNISASIRYTAWDYWVVMRGQGLRNKRGAGYAQYPANAELLTMRGDFSGSWFSAGDRYISEVAIKKDRTGNPTTWLRAGINHHVTFVVDQLKKIFGRSRT